MEPYTPRIPFADTSMCVKRILFGDADACAVDRRMLFAFPVFPLKLGVFEGPPEDLKPLYQKMLDGRRDYAKPRLGNAEWVLLEDNRQRQWFCPRLFVDVVFWRFTQFRCFRLYQQPDEQDRAILLVVYHGDVHAACCVDLLQPKQEIQHEFSRDELHYMAGLNRLHEQTERFSRELNGEWEES